MESVEPGRERTQVKVVTLQTIHLCPFPPLHLDGEEVLRPAKSARKHSQAEPRQGQPLFPEVPQSPPNLRATSSPLWLPVPPSGALWTLDLSAQPQSPVLLPAPASGPGCRSRFFPGQRGGGLTHAPRKLPCLALPQTTHTQDKPPSHSEVDPLGTALCSVKSLC